jgi:hypothetical protein
MPIELCDCSIGHDQYPGLARQQLLFLCHAIPDNQEEKKYSVSSVPPPSLSKFDACHQSKAAAEVDCMKFLKTSAPPPRLKAIFKRWPFS